MGLSTSDINASYQKIELDVKIGGSLISRVFGVDVSMGLSQVNAAAQIHLTSRPSGAEELDPVEIWFGYGGQTEIIFKGELTGRHWEFFPGVITLEARDLLARLRLDWGGDDREYTSQDDAAIIQNLVEAMGISSSQTHIESSSWTLGVVETVVAPGGRSFWPLVAEIDDLAGFKTFTTRAGVIWRQRVSGSAGSGSKFSYSQGTNIIKIDRRINEDGIVNKCIVTGITYADLQVGGPGIAEASAANPFVPDPPRYITRSIQSNLVEDDDKALEIAERVVSDGNRRPESFELTVLCNPKLNPADVISVEADGVEAVSARLVIDRIQHSIRTGSGSVSEGDPLAKTTITTLGGNIAETAANIPPIATFTVDVFQEAEDTGMGVESRIIVVADGSASSDPDGDTLTYAWTLSVDAGSIAPTTGTSAKITAVISGAATTLTVSLTVTDTGGATATFSQDVTLDSNTLQIEPIYLATDGQIEASNDGELTWNVFSGVSGATCTSPFAANAFEIWGDDSGHIWATKDYLATAAVDLGAPHGAVACTAVYINELDATRIWAAFADGRIYFGTADPTVPSATWTLQGTIPEGLVNEIRETLGALGGLRATAGAGYYASEDAGNTWSLLHSFDTAWRMAAGFDTNLASGLNDPAPLYAETGTTPTVPGGVEHIRGLSFGWRTKVLAAADDSAQLYLTDDTLSALTLQTDVAPAGVNHMIRSGSIDGPLFYLACGDGTGDNGAVKWIPGTTPWFIRRTALRQCAMIGYGPAHGPPTGPFGVIVLPYAAAGGDDKIWVLQNGVWSGLTPPQSGWYWECICVNPLNQDEWLLYGVSNSSRWAGRADADNTVYGDNGGAATTGTAGPLYRSTDAGATWSSVTLTLSATDGDHLYAQNHYLAYSEDVAGLWMLIARNTFFHNHSYTWRGTGGGTVAGIKHASSSLHDLTSGLNGEFVTSTVNETALGQDANLYYLDTSSAMQPTTEDPSTDPSYRWESIETLPGTRSAIGYRAVAPTAIWGCHDYRSTAVDKVSPRSTAPTNGVFITAAQHGVYAISSTGPQRIADVFGGSGPVEVGDDHTPLANIRAGRRRRLAVAGLRNDAVVVATTDGTTWQTLTAPPVGDISKLNLNHFEVFEP